MNITRVAGSRVEAVTPLEKRLSLRACGTRLLSNRRGIEGAASRLRGADAYAPIAAVAAGLFIRDKSVVDVEDSVVVVYVTESLTLWVLPLDAGASISCLVVLIGFALTFAWVHITCQQRQ